MFNQYLHIVKMSKLKNRPNVKEIVGEKVFRKDCKCDVQSFEEKDICGTITAICNKCNEIVYYIDKSLTPKIKLKSNKQKPEKEHIKLDRNKQKTDIDIKQLYDVRSVAKKMTHDWLKNKHYARRVPPIEYAFCLFDKSGKVCGVCTFGPPSRMLNSGKHVFDEKVEVDTVELNRLCIDESAPKNTLSYFVAQCFHQLPKPMCVVSYADGNQNHHGFIYQATNWIYTGEIEPMRKFIDTNTGKEVHQRTISSRYGNCREQDLPPNIKIEHESSGKHRYFMFLGNKTELKIMRKNLKYDVMPYPKGENSRYDAKHESKSQQLELF